jgi:Ca2+-binding RTX toxin-like protein
VALPPPPPADPTPAPQQLYGGSGDSILVGGTGNDVLQGGSSDTGEWDFYLSASGQVEAYHHGTTGSVDVLTPAQLNTGVAALSFAGASAATLQELVLLYQTAFGRAPDLAGLSFWAATNDSLAQLAQGFSSAPEWQSGNATLSDAAFVDQLYENALGHAGSAAETAAALAQLSGAADNATARVQLLVSISQSSEEAAAQQTSNSLGLVLGTQTVTQEQGWIAGSGNDTLDGGGGNNLLVGGDGIDTVVYHAPLSAYQITLTSAGDVSIVAANGNTDIIRGIEIGQFSDATVDLSFTQATPAQLNEIGLLYQVALGRAADLGGIAFWAGAGLDAVALATSFTASAEFQADYGAMSNAAFVAAIEQNALHHAADAGTLQTWTAYLDNHSRAEMLVALIGTPEVQTAQYGAHGLVLV